jgi:signal transduction histidine kinase
LDSPNAPDYLSVLVEKSERLRKLTDDLFEAAKASSGALPVRSERLDLRALVDQALAETAESFAASQLEVILSAEEETLLTNADGTLLWRVLDNLLGNVRKYALPGSRVYVDMGRGTGSFSQPSEGTLSPLPYTQLEIKNISAQPLNIPADELMERFKRGDESRATEGSGLGLTISRDLAHLMDGHLDVVIDGDLFKVVLLLPCWRG